MSDRLLDIILMTSQICHLNAKVLILRKSSFANDFFTHNLTVSKSKGDVEIG